MSSSAPNGGQSSGQGSQQHQGPPRNISFPHLAPVAVLGGVPTVKTDVPISAVFMFLFVLGAIFHMTLFQINMRKKKKKFIISAVIFGFCMSRIVTTSMRIAWACHTDNVRVAIASQIFNNAGVVLLFIVNLIFAQRILRAEHPRYQWHKPLSIAFKAYYFSIVGVLIIVITSTCLSFYTADPAKQKRYADMRKFGIVYFAVFSTSALWVLLAAAVLPTREERQPFGHGRLRTQVIIVAVATILLAFGSIFRAVIAFLPARPINNPPWYTSRAVFYNIFFTVEVLVVILYAVMRVDRRFHIPDKKDRLAAREGKFENGQDDREEQMADDIAN